MRILHVDSGREMRGGQWQALRLHRGLLAAGHESLLLAREASPLWEVAQERGLASEPLRPPGLPKISRRFDIVHAHDARSHSLCALLARVPLVVSRRVAFPVKTSPLSQWKYRRPALFLAVSKHVATLLMQAGVPETRIAVVYDGISVPVEVSNGDKVLVPWTLDPDKGMALALAAAARAGITLTQSKNLAADLPGARALLYLSYSEGLGSGILMAMAHGVTVIASDTGGIPELITDGVNGILVPNEIGAIAAALSRTSQQFGSAARLTVLNRFTEDHMIQATVAAYERTLSQ